MKKLLMAVVAVVALVVLYNGLANDPMPNGGVKDPPGTYYPGDPRTGHPVATSAWVYGYYVDPLNGAQGARYATLISDNVLDLKEGVGKATLTVEENPHVEVQLEGTLELSLGMIDDGRTRIRFDDGKVMYLDEVADWEIRKGDNGMRYRGSYSIWKYNQHKGDFLTLLKKSKHLRMEVPIVDNGSQILEFSTAGLDLPILTGGKKGKSKGRK